MVIALASEKRQIRFLLDNPFHVKRHFARVIVAPHARLSARHFPARRNVVPAIWPMINRVHEQTLMLCVGWEVSLVKKSSQHSQSSLPVTCAGFFVASIFQVMPEPEQPLCSNR